MTTPGKMTHRFRFESRKPTPGDGYGNSEGEWQERFTAWVGLRPLRGSETVIAARMQGTQPVIITVRSSLQSREIAPHWRAVDDRTGATYNIRSVADMAQSRMFVEMMAESGGPDG